MSARWRAEKKIGQGLAHQTNGVIDRECQQRAGEDAQMTNMLTKAEAVQMADTARAAGVEARAKTHDYAPQNPDGSYTGEVVSRYSVMLVLRDERHGNTIIRDLREVCDVSPVIKEMRRELRTRAGETRARIRTEREGGRS